MSDLPKILSFSGRKRSGKTELANVCIKYNYKLINFADALKNLVCNMLGITLNYLEEHKDIIFNYDLKSKIKYISEQTEIDESIVKNVLNRSFDSIRSILQTIGTELIRGFNPMWHVNKIRDKITSNPDNYYCIGDTRFVNEKELITELGGECWYIIRPDMREISNHESEISLKWVDFGKNIIINNGDKQTLIDNWEKYLNTIKNNKLNKPFLNTFFKNELRKVLIELSKGFSIREIAKIGNCNQSQVIWWFNNLMININYDQCDPTVFLECTKETCYLVGLLKSGGSIKGSVLSIQNKNKDIITLFNDKLGLKNKEIEYKMELNSNNKIYFLNCNNPFVVENLKLWCITTDEIPDMIKDNSLLKYWIIGLIDGHNVEISKNNVCIVSSKNIINYLYSVIQYGYDSEKYVRQLDDKLYELNFVDKYAINFINWLNHAYSFSLNKKWEKLFF